MTAGSPPGARPGPGPASPVRASRRRADHRIHPHPLRRDPRRPSPASDVRRPRPAAPSVLRIAPSATQTCCAATAIPAGFFPEPRRLALHRLRVRRAARLVAFLVLLPKCWATWRRALPETRLYEAQLEAHGNLAAPSSPSSWRPTTRRSKLQRSEQMNHLRAWIDGQLQQQMLRYQRLPGASASSSPRPGPRSLSQTPARPWRTVRCRQHPALGRGHLARLAEPRVIPQERAALIRQLPGLIQTLKEGPRHQHPPGDTEVFLQHLMQWHTQALKEPWR